MRAVHKELKTCQLADEEMEKGLFSGGLANELAGGHFARFDDEYPGRITRFDDEYPGRITRFDDE